MEIEAYRTRIHELLNTDSRQVHPDLRQECEKLFFNLAELSNHGGKTQTRYAENLIHVQKLLGADLYNQCANAAKEMLQVCNKQAVLELLSEAEREYRYISSEISVHRSALNVSELRAERIQQLRTLRSELKEFMYELEIEAQQDKSVTLQILREDLRLALLRLHSREQFFEDNNNLPFDVDWLSMLARCAT